MVCRKPRQALRVGAAFFIGGVFLSLCFFFTETESFVRGRTGSALWFWPNARTSLNLRLGCPETPLLHWGPCWDDAAADAAAHWNNAAVQFRFLLRSPVILADHCAHGDRVNTVAFAPTICGMVFGNALAVTILVSSPTGELLDTDVIFDRERQWSTYPGPLRPASIDFHRVAIHEFGHVLGLAHPDEHGQSVVSLMNSRISNLDDLQPDDILGVNTIYTDVTPDTGLGSNDHCKVAGPCGAGQGDCDSTQECQNGLVCVNDVGANYGFRPIVDVCETPTGNNTLGGNDYCKVAGPCGAGEGDCDSNQECQSGLVCVNDVGANYGFRSIVDVCETPPDHNALGGNDYCKVAGPCDAGEGDCDSNQECQSGLVCVNDVGANYGFRPIVDVCETPGTGGASLNGLLGRWEFVYTIISTFRDHYHLQQIETVNGTPVATGVDLDAGGPVIAGRVSDFSSNPLSYTFMLLDPDAGICDFFLFNQLGPNSLEGVYFLVTTDALGNCATPFGPSSPMTGHRLGNSLTSGVSPAPHEVTSLKLQEAMTTQFHALANGEQQLSSEVLGALLRRLQDPAAQRQ